MQQPSWAELGQGIAVGELLPLVPFLCVLLPGTEQPEGRASFVWHGCHLCCLGQLASSQRGKEPLLPRCRERACRPPGRKGPGGWVGGETSAPAAVPARVSPAACQCPRGSPRPGRDSRDGARQPLGGAKGRAAALLGAVARATCPASARGPCQPRCGRAWLPGPQGRPSLLLLSLPSSRHASNMRLSQVKCWGGEGGEAEGSMPANLPALSNFAILPLLPPPNCCHILGLFLELPSQGGSTQRRLWGDGREQTAASGLPQMHGDYCAQRSQPPQV